MIDGFVHSAAGTGLEGAGMMFFNFGKRSRNG